MVNLTGSDIRVPAGNTNAVSGQAVGFDDGAGKYMPASEDNPLPVLVAQRPSNWVAVAKTITATQYFLMVDLSDTTRWHHVHKNYIVIEQLYLSANKTSGASGSVRIGVVTRVGATDSDVVFFGRLDFTNGNADIPPVPRNFFPRAILLEQLDGVLLHTVSTGRVTGITSINSATALETPFGTADVIPQVGDLILEFGFTGSGQYTATVSIMYDSF